MTFDSIITKEVYEIPDCFKQHKDMVYRYVDIYNDGVVVGRVALGIVDKRCILHGNVESWSKVSLKAIKTGFFSVIVPGLKEVGVKDIGVFKHADDPGVKKLVKFAKLFHFGKPRYLIYLHMEI